MRKILFVGCSILGLMAPAYAQEADDAPLGADSSDAITIADYRVREDSLTITVTGNPSEVEDTGQPVNVIGAEEIADVQGPDLARVLQRVPGVTINRNGGLGSTTGVSVRGAANDKLLVLIDGVRVADTASPAGGFDFGTLSAANLSKVEVMRGANSVVWGADALAGVLVASTFERSGLAGSVEAGSRGTVSTSVEGGIGGDAGFVGGSVGYITTDGFSAAASVRS